MQNLEVSSSLGDLYMGITMLVGETVDVYPAGVVPPNTSFNDRLKKILMLQEL